MLGGTVVAACNKGWCRDVHQHFLVGCIELIAERQLRVGRSVAVRKLSRLCSGCQRPFPGPINARSAVARNVFRSGPSNDIRKLQPLPGPRSDRALDAAPAVAFPICLIPPWLRMRAQTCKRWLRSRCSEKGFCIHAAAAVTTTQHAGFHTSDCESCTRPRLAVYNECGTRSSLGV